ncbi:MAG: phenylalanine--tRNA ligase subunit beta, partial [Asgard group archaeon]|nr:phenylalanine--tRNA ligase subunit beta [Asgard group archaeon]
AEIIKETPTFALQEKTVKAKYVKDILGLNLKKAEIKTYLEKARLNVLPYKKGARTLTVEIPSFRTDILHEIDLVEEVAITYGYHNLEPVLDNFVTIGQEHPIVKLQNKCREIMSGLGFLEIFNFTLVSRDWQYDKMRTKGNPVVLLNPVSKEYNIVRDSLLPGLLKVLEENKPYPLPQKIFDTGDVCLVDKNQETKVKREIFLSGASIHSKADFVEIKSIVVAILDALGIKEYHFQETEHPSFFSGRCANVFVNDEIVGIFGEIHPLVLENFDLENPVGAFELKVEKIIN